MDIERKLLVNGLLICELRGCASISEKLSNLKKHLADGADINTTDANDNNNTPLHIAAKKEESDIIDFLLKMGADPNKMNKNQQTPLDLAKLSQHIHESKVINILENATNHVSQTIGAMQAEPSEEKQQIRHDKKRSIVSTTEQHNQNKSGTAGDSGQQYEKKLIGLILLRALGNNDIETFYLGSNIPEIGIFDDIVFRYRVKNNNHSKIIFIQAKHRDNPEKDKLTVSTILKPNTDLSLEKYFESYINVKKKIKQNNKIGNIFKFQEDFNSLDCSFIIYTTAIENFQKKKLIEIQGTEEDLLFTSKNGIVFMYDYDNDDIKILLRNTIYLKASLLAKSLAKLIARGSEENSKNIMFDELIKVYHVFLAENVVQINEDENGCLKGKLRKNFLENEDEIFVHLKLTMLKELKKIQKFARANEIDYRFNLPNGFGNIGVVLNDSEYINISKVIENLYHNGKEKSNDLCILVVNDRIGSEHNVFEASSGCFSPRDIHRLGKLLGEALITDDRTGLLKLNLGNSSSLNSRKLVENLRANTAIVENDFEKIRFDINIDNFPKLVLCDENHQIEIIKDFLNKLKFYTGQAKEEDVENILKTEINERYNTKCDKSDTLYYIHGDTIYLKYQDNIHKWWKHRNTYLTKDCKFYEGATNDVLNKPLLKTYSYNYIKKIEKYAIKFDQIAIDNLMLHEFIRISNAKILNIITKDKIMTSIKINQCFKNNLRLNNYDLLDLDFVIAEGHDSIVLSGMLSEATADIIILIMNERNYVTDSFITAVIEQCKKKIIVVSHSKALSEVVKHSFEFLEEEDHNNSLRFFDSNSKHMIIDPRNILNFQGEKVPFVSIVNENMHHIVNGKVLHDVIKKKYINIGKEPKNIEAYNDNIVYYISRNMSRCIKLTGEYKVSFNVIVDKIKSVNKIVNKRDTLIISNKSKVFEEACKRKNNKNVHWFQKDDVNNMLLWRKSHGSLEKIFPFVEQCEQKGFSYNPQSLRDLNERIVLISAGPGMGKSTLISHLMMQTKYQDQSMCVIKINLLDLKNEFCSWQKCHVGKRMIWVLLIIYKLFSYYSNNIIVSAINSKETTNEVISAIVIDQSGQFHFHYSEANDSKEQEQALFEFHIFLNLYNNGKMLLVIDAFDEICPDYKQEAIEILRLLKTSRISNMWITSRSCMIKALENEMNTFSFNLVNFSYDEQIGFLEKFWMKHSPVSSERLRNLRMYVTQFFDAINHKIRLPGETLTATPLHLRMVAEVYKDYFIKYYFENNLKSDEREKLNKDLKNAFNLTNLYEKFIYIKFFKIRFGEKKDWFCFEDPDVRTTINKEYSYFIQDHEKVAAHSLLPKSDEANILTKDDLLAVDNFIKRFNLGEEKNGIIETIISNDVKFVHFTFGEYFANEYICDKLTQNLFSHPVWDYLVTQVLGNGGIGYFFDARLENDTNLSHFTCKSVCDALLMQKKLFGSALLKAVNERRYNIAQFLLNNLANHINTNNLDEFLNLISRNFIIFRLCDGGYQDHILLEQIVEIIKRVDCHKLITLFFTKRTPIAIVFMRVFVRYGAGDDRFDILLKYLNSDDLTKLLVTPFEKRYNRTILHIIVNETHNLSSLKYLENLNLEQRMMVFCARDDDKRVPAHYAAKYNNYNFFAVMEQLVGLDKLKYICRLTDNFNMVPLLCANPINDIRGFKLFCEKAVFEIGFIDKEQGGGWYLVDEENQRYFSQFRCKPKKNNPRKIVRRRT